MGDFLGFEFGGVHSSELGITRVSGGDRYEEQLHPEIKDRTAEVPGVNGEYYFGSDYGTRTFDLEIAFDSLTEYQFKRLRKIFGTKDIKKLVFDERPYKYYMVKLESPIQLSYVCFEEPNYTWEKIQTAYNTYLPGIKSEYYEHKVYDDTIKRVYKGEGKISLIAHFPFAKSNFKVLPTEGHDYYEGSEEWAYSSGILNSDQYASVDNYSNNSITVYNPGDIETGFRLYLPAAALSSTTTLTYKVDGVHTTAALALKTMSLKTGDVGVMIDTNSQLIIGVSSAPTLNVETGTYDYTTSGNLYNQYISSGQFFHLQTNSTYVYSTLQITDGASGIRIFYDYLYF